MAIVLQILLLLVLLAGLITVGMSVKNWHWVQMVLLLGVVLFGAFALVLAAEVLRVHRAQRSGIAKLQEQVSALEDENAALRDGTRDAALANRIFPEGLPFDMDDEGRMPAFSTWSQRLQAMSRQRGRVWRKVRGGAVDASGQVEVEISDPKPHRLDQNAIVYAFEEGPASGANPGQIAQYLGEFRVISTSETGAQLQSVLRLDNRTGNRISQSQRPWSLYETIPADRHELFAGLRDEDLQQTLPPASAEEYIRHGKPATDDDDEFHTAGYDENGRRVGPEDLAKAVEMRYDRPLRDYSYLFAELARQRVVLLADVSALTEDVIKLQAAHATAEKLSAYREQEKTSLAADLEKMIRDRSAIEKLRDSVAAQLKNGRDLVVQAIQYNAELVEVLSQRHVSGGAAVNFGLSGSFP